MIASLIIPTYNSCERLYNNLVSLKYQSCEKSDFEVIVADDGSKDNTYDMVSHFDANYKLKLINIKCNKGRSYARNKAIENADGKIIIFHDSDMIANKNFVSNHISSHESNNTVVCGASWKKIFSFHYNDFNDNQKIKFEEIKNNYYSNFSINADRYPLLKEEEIINEDFYKYSFELDSRKKIFDKIVQKYGNTLNNYNLPWRFFITNNTSVNKEKIIEIGLFDEKFKGWGCEDYDLGYRLYMNNCNFIVKNEIISIHQEHPVNPHDNGIKNILYFCKKYNTIDIALLYFINLTSIKNEWLNDIIGEAKVLCRNEKYKVFIDAYSSLLQELSIRYKKNMPLLGVNDIINISKYYDVNNILMLEDDIKRKYGFSYFNDSFNILFEDIYGIDIAKSRFNYE